MAAMAYTFDADLDVVLQAARNDELEPLVILLSKDKSRKPLNSFPEFAHYYPDHQRYVHLISSKLRALGGHQLGNLWRGGLGPSYLSVVQAVASHLKVPFSKHDSIIAIEQKLLDHVFADCYQHMSKEEQNLLVQELQSIEPKLSSSTALVVVESGDSSQLSERGRLLVATIVSHAVGKAVGFSLETWEAVNTLVGKSWAQLTQGVSHTVARLTALMASVKALGRPAYQILVPCVLHIAALRLMQAGTKLPSAMMSALPGAKEQ